MDNTTDPRPDAGGEPEIADAESLFRDDPRPGPAAPQAPPPTGAPQESLYDFAEVDASEPVRPALPPLDVPTAGKPRAAAASAPRLEPSRAVEQVWSRGAEWTGSLMILAVVAAGLLVLLYATVSSELYGVAFLLLVVGGLGLAVLSYPILITLERPVRVTPEQAVADFYTALSHHVPHYRRMWLLLSNAGRVGGAFASFEGFQAYWRGRLAELRAGRASSFTPLKFVVVDFRSEKSAGKSEIDATYTVNVFVRGRAQEGPVEQIRVSSTFVKGPDRMWYLDRGTLP